MEILVDNKADLNIHDEYGVSVAIPMVVESVTQTCASFPGTQNRVLVHMHIHFGIASTQKFLIHSTYEVFSITVGCEATLSLPSE